MQGLPILMHMESFAPAALGGKGSAWKMASPFSTQTPYPRGERSEPKQSKRELESPGYV
ncbi:hypothetical protein KSB_50070 [Ktedonobacter robiniae]|uniref:Uncharacterized protein n=1 Tax=Ktedonobacter robiniae TaxID=2778365 RepID=A0ABQ3UVV3_9CHLR|nr:hypothetical protein KSB_50070 [Ktedonobacter robiniae]